MKLDTVVPLYRPDDVHQYVLGLWAEDGPIKKSHEEGGVIWKLIDDFARLPCFFAEMSDPKIEWTHFVPWWRGVFLCTYDNPHIRDLRYLHEIKHAATMPYTRDMTLSTFRNKIRENEHEASAFSEQLIYLDFPELRALTFQHPIFMDRFLFPEGDFNHPDEELLERWRREPDIVAKELQLIRANVLTDKAENVDMDDPQIAWLRRYPTQGREWIKIWTPRYRLVEEACVNLRERRDTIGAQGALEEHLQFLTSPAITNGTDIPFYEEAAAFRGSYDRLIAEYDEKMDNQGLQAVKNTSGQKQAPPSAVDAFKCEP